MNIVEVKCRKCSKIFSFNNQLHKHIRFKVCLKSSMPVKQLHSSESDTTEKISQIDGRQTQLIRFIVTTNDIDKSYSFRNWHYAMILISLKLNEDFKSVCFDTKCSVFLIDRQFVQQVIKALDILIKVMTSSISVREIDQNAHFIFEFVVLSIYISEVVEEKSATAMITREYHIVNDLRVNMLVGMNVMSLEMIDIITFKRIIHIDSCKMNISVKIQTKDQRVRQVVLVDKITVISIMTQLAIPIRYNKNKNLLERDFLFESSHIKLTLFAHVIDSATNFILIRNEFKSLITISRKFRLEIITNWETMTIIIIWKIKMIYWLSNLSYSHITQVEPRWTLQRSTSRAKNHWKQRCLMTLRYTRIPKSRKSWYRSSKIFQDDERTTILLIFRWMSECVSHSSQIENQRWLKRPKYTH